MSWNLLAYVIPAVGAIKAFSAVNPTTYRKYEDAPESLHTATVKTVAERVMQAAMESGIRYQERIDEMFQELPDSVGVKNVQAVVANRLKVIAVSNQETPIHATGTDVETEGKFFIVIDPAIERTAQEALPWIATHEICHILEGDWVELPCIKTIASLSATILSTFVLGWGLLPSACAAIAANMVTHLIVSHRAENRADDFANKHCTLQEREQAIAYFESIKNSRPQGGVSAYVGKIIRSILHPSEDARIAKIRGSLGPVENRKTA